MISEIKVLKSNAGYYVGRELVDNETGWSHPYDRISDYFESREEADAWLRNLLEIQET